MPIISMSGDCGLVTVTCTRCPSRWSGVLWVISVPNAKYSFFIAMIIPAREGVTPGRAVLWRRYFGNRLRSQCACFCFGDSFVSVIIMMSGCDWSWMVWISSCAVLMPCALSVHAVKAGCGTSVWYIVFLFWFEGVSVLGTGGG